MPSSPVSLCHSVALPFVRLNLNERIYRMVSQGRRIETVEVTFQILECISSAGPGGTDITSLLRETNIPRRTVYRHLAYLQDLGLVETRSDGFNLYRLGPTVETWAASSSRQREFLHLSDTYVAELADSSGHLVHCTVFDQGSVLTVAAGTRPDPNAAPPLAVAGTRRPAHASASGKVFLAYKRGALSAYVTRPLVGLTDNTITTAQGLRDEVAAVRRNGYAEDVHEFVKGVCCIAVPVWGDHGVVGALSASQDWPAERPYELNTDLLRSLKEAAAEFTKKIGGRHGH